MSDDAPELRAFVSDNGYTHLTHADGRHSICGRVALPSVYLHGSRRLRTVADDMRLAEAGVKVCSYCETRAETLRGGE